MQGVLSVCPITITITRLVYALLFRLTFLLLKIYLLYKFNVIRARRLHCRRRRRRRRRYIFPTQNERWCVI